MAAFILNTPWHGAQTALRRTLSKLRQNRTLSDSPISFAVTIKLIYHMIEVVGKRLHQSALRCISDTDADGLRMTRTMELAGKVCLVTGGASGIGARTALAFSRRGAQIAVTGLGPQIDSPEMRKVSPAADVPGVLYIQSDAGIAEDCTRAVAETVCPLWAPRCSGSCRGRSRPRRIL